MAKIKTIIKIQLPAGKATPAPPVGTILGPQGINLGQFVSQFNERTRPMEGSIIPAEITIFDDRTFEFKLKTPPASDLLRRAAGVEKGSGVPNKQKVGKVSKTQLREIAEKKMPDLNADTIEAAEKIVAGSARQMGIEIKD